MSNIEQWILLIIIIILFLLLCKVYIANLIELRNESEYRDIVEYEVMLAAQLLSVDPKLLNTLGKIRFFPDNSGFFIVIDFNGSLLVHGDYNGNLSDTSKLPFELPVKDIIDTAKQGGGYIRYNYRGNLYQSFIYPVPDSNMILSSGLIIDSAFIKKRQQWKRYDKTMMKRNKETKKYTNNTKIYE